MTETGDTQQEAPKSFVLLAPAISPVYHNNPAFRVVSLETDQLVLLDYTQYYMDLVMATGEEYQCSLFPSGGGGGGSRGFAFKSHSSIVIAQNFRIETKIGTSM